MRPRSGWCHHAVVPELRESKGTDLARPFYVGFSFPSRVALCVFEQRLCLSYFLALDPYRFLLSLLNAVMPPAVTPPGRWSYARRCCKIVHYFSLECQ